MGNSIRSLFVQLLILQSHLARSTYCELALQARSLKKTVERQRASGAVSSFKWDCSTKKHNYIFDSSRPVYANEHPDHLRLCCDFRDSEDSQEFHLSRNLPQSRLRFLIHPLGVMIHEN